MTNLQWKMESEIGPLFLVASVRGLRGVFWKKQAARMAESLQERSPEAAFLSRAAAQLEEYLKGARRSFDLPLDAEGSEFQKSVWAQLGRIPYGRTVSYRDVAREIKKDKAVRAVGTANGKNPLCIIVPCHRVIASDGSLGGYSGGLEIKNKLLALERKAG